MVTYRYICYDLLETLRQTNDDKEITLNQVLFWVRVIENRLLSQHISKRINDGSLGSYLSIFPNVPVLKQTYNDENVLKNRYYIELPKDIYNFPNEAGIEYITYCATEDICCDGLPVGQVPFQRTIPSKIHVLYGDPYMKPDSDNPYFYRTDNKIWFLGLECVDVDCLEIGIYTKVDTQDCDLDDTLKIDDELISVLKYELLELGRWSLMIPRERINDGSDQTTQYMNANNIKIPEVTMKSDLSKMLSNANKQDSQQQQSQ